MQGCQHLSTCRCVLILHCTLQHVCHVCLVFFLHFSFLCLYWSVEKWFFAFCILCFQFVVITFCAWTFIRPPSSPMARFPACGHQVSLLESVAFDRDLSDQVRARVLEELAAINARINEARWPGQARASWGLLQGWESWHGEHQVFFTKRWPAKNILCLCEAFVASCLCRWSNFKIFKMVVSYLYPCSSKKSTEDSPGFCL